MNRILKVLVPKNGKSGIIFAFFAFTEAKGCASAAHIKRIIQRIALCGAMLTLGSGVLADELANLQQQAEHGDVKAMIKLGGNYAREKSPNYAQAFKWLSRAAEMGDAGAMLSVSAMYSNGRGVVMDKAEALVWLNRAAQAGNLTAINALGRMYALGEGVPQNTSIALKWFHLAADKGDTDAMMKIGDIYANGRGGIKVDWVETAKWIRMASDRGNGDAMAYLSTLYIDGQGVERDPLKAYEWAYKAVDAGNVKAKALRDTLKSALHLTVDKPWTTTCASVKAKFDPDGTITLEKFKELMISMGYKWSPTAEQNFAAECKAAIKKIPVTAYQQLWPSNIMFKAKLVDDNGVCRFTEVLLEPCE